MRLALVAMLAACRGGSAVPPAGDAAQRTAACDERREPAAGLVIERHADGDTCIVVVRLSPARWSLRVHTALADGGVRPAPAWAEAFGLTGVINASMYHADLRSIGMLATGAVENNPRDNPKLGAYFVFDPVDPADTPWLLAGRGCPGVDVAALRKRYRSIVQNYRMLDCDGRPVDWKDEGRHSAAAVGVDREGRAVLILSPAARRTAEHIRRLAAPELGLTALMYVEGGPEASLYVKIGGDTVSEAGRLDVGIAPFWSIPNVIGFVPKE